MQQLLTTHWLDTARYSNECFINLVGGASLFSGESRQVCIDFCEQNADVVVKSLPASLAIIAEAGEFGLVLDLVNLHGGKRIYLPTRASRFSTLTGTDFPPDLYRRWRDIADVNGQLDVPSIWGLFLALRRAAIRVALACDWTPEALYATFGVTKRQLKLYRIT